jgi:hypothetical protein
MEYVLELASPCVTPVFVSNLHIPLRCMMATAIETARASTEVSLVAPLERSLGGVLGSAL